MGAGVRLVSDVGGTNVRFALADGAGAITARRSHRVREHASFLAALDAYRAGTGAVPVASFAIGAAGPVEGGKVSLTNAPWTIDAGEVSAHLGGVPGALVNDLEAAAMALPYLDDAHLRPLGLPEARAARRQRMLAVNVGTGFGAAAVLPVGGVRITCPSEAGHMTLSAACESECRLLEAGASVEDVLSGRGLAALHRVLGASEPLDAAEILDRASSDPVAVETCRIFTALLGRVAGDLVLAYAAWGGVFLFGSVIRGWADAGDTGLFREVFNGKGAMRARMRNVPAAIVTHDDAALLGLTHLPLN